MPVTFTPTEKGMKINGKIQIKMTDYGIDPPAPKIALGLITHVIFKVPMTEWVIVVSDFTICIAIVHSILHVNPISGEGVFDLHFFYHTLLVPLSQFI